MKRFASLHSWSQMHVALSMRLPLSMHTRAVCWCVTSLPSSSNAIAVVPPYVCRLLFIAGQIGHVSMKRDGVFHTWIDYPKFHELVASGEHFTAADYMAPTPDWAAFNPVRTCCSLDPLHEHCTVAVALCTPDCLCVRQVYMGKSAGFDPEETRFYRKGSAAAAAAAAAAGGSAKADFEVPYVPSESGCG